MYLILIKAHIRNRLFIAVTLLALSFCICPSATVQGQSMSAASSDSLYKVIRHMDSVLFDAFNNHDLNTLKAVFASDVEFYHDRGGIQDYSTVIENFGKIFVTTPGLRRQLVEGSLAVYPVPGFGAIEMGEHRFTHVENGKEVVGLYKFTHIWRYKDQSWKITRVVSVGH